MTGAAPAAAAARAAAVHLDNTLEDHRREIRRRVFVRRRAPLSSTACPPREIATAVVVQRPHGQLCRVHCWLAPPLHDQRMIFVPLAAPAPLASSQRPDCTPLLVAFELTSHCWFAWLWQSQMITWVPLVVP